MNHFLSVRPVRGGDAPRRVPSRGPVALVLEAPRRRSTRSRRGSGGERARGDSSGGAAAPRRGAAVAAVATLAVFAAAAAAAPFRPRRSAPSPDRPGPSGPRDGRVDREQGAANHVGPSGDDAAQRRARLEGDKAKAAVLPLRGRRGGSSFFGAVPQPLAPAPVAPVPREVDV
jgi:hypothetical protein